MSEHLSLAWWAADVATRTEPVIYRKSRRQRWVFLFRQRFASFFLSEKWRRPFVIYCFTFLRCSVTKNSGRSKGVRFLCFGFCGRADATAPRPVLHCHVLLFAVVVPVFFSQSAGKRNGSNGTGRQSLHARFTTNECGNSLNITTTTTIYQPAVRRVAKHSLPLGRRPAAAGVERWPHLSVCGKCSKFSSPAPELRSWPSKK